MRETFLATLVEIQPSQLYISSEKLERVLTALGEVRIESMEPIPIRCLSGRSVYTDGHTRAFAAFRGGHTQIPVYWDEDELDWEAYDISVDWCLDAGIRCIADLQGRVVTPDEYDVLWLQRCSEMQRDLESRRSKG